MIALARSEDFADLLRRAAPIIAHDLNNLRAVAQGNLRLARENVAAGRWDEVAEPLADVDLAFQQIAALTRGVLALAGEAPAVAPAAVALPPVLQRAEALLRWALPPQFAVEVRAPGHEMQVPAEAELLAAALVSLALCARDAPAGGAVRIAAGDAPGDAGPGTRSGCAQVCVEIPSGEPAAGAGPPGRDRAALRREFALALARRSVAGCGGEVTCGVSEGRTSVCLLLPLATPDGV